MEITLRLPDKLTVLPATTSPSRVSLLPCPSQTMLSSGRWMFPPKSCSEPPGRSDSLGFCSLVHGPLINFCAAAQPILCTAAP
jgi:hypothetical protein